MSVRERSGGIHPHFLQDAVGSDLLAKCGRFDDLKPMPTYGRCIRNSILPFLRDGGIPAEVMESLKSVSPEAKRAFNRLVVSFNAELEQIKSAQDYALVSQYCREFLALKG